MNKYLIVTSKNGNTVSEQLVLSSDMETALAEAKALHADKPLSFAAHAEQVKGQFDRFPLIANVCSINDSQITAKVYHNGWTVQVDGKDTSLADIPSTFHSMIKAVVKSTAYDAGYYTSVTPVGGTALWDRMDWINHVSFNYDI
jgi:hypothetical protein